MRISAAMFCLAILAAGCGPSNGGRASSGDKLYEAVSAPGRQDVSVIDSRSHTAERRLPLGVATGDWKHLYSIVSTSLVDTDPATGSTLRTLQLGGAYELPQATAAGLPGGLSPAGTWLVVESFDRPGSATHLLLIDTAALKISRRLDLNGHFEFDAVSNDGARVYLIERLNGSDYDVRLYDVPAARLDPGVVVDKSEGEASMTGLRLSGVAGADGGYLFSVYARDHESPFIHALSLDGPFAFCLDLPGRGYTEDSAATQWSLAMSPDGATLYAVNAAEGTVAVLGVWNDAPHIARIGQITPSLGGDLVPVAQAKELGPDAAAVSRDGTTLVAGGGSGLSWIDTATLKVVRHALSGWRIWSVGLSPDGSKVYALSEGGRIAEVSMADAAVVAEFDAPVGQPIALMRVAAA